MISNKERTQIGKFLQEMSKKGFDFNGKNIAMAIDANCAFDKECWDRLACLIIPENKIDLDEIQKICCDGMECCDEPEWSLYSTIFDAIAKYKRGESYYGVYEHDKVNKDDEESSVENMYFPESVNKLKDYQIKSLRDGVEYAKENFPNTIDMLGDS